MRIRKKKKKVRVEITKAENMETAKKMKKTKSLLLEKTN